MIPRLFAYITISAPGRFPVFLYNRPWGWAPATAKNDKSDNRPTYVSSIAYLGKNRAILQCEKPQEAHL